MMELDFTQQYDVAVFGAGIGGIAAALAAARRGHEVCLVEKQTQIGGLATSGMIFIYLPLCDGENHQVTFGIAEELLLAGRKYGPYDISRRWGGEGDPLSDEALSEGHRENNILSPRDRFACNFTPAGMILALDEILRTAGVDLYLDTLLCDAEVTEGRVTGAYVENISGRGLIRAGYFVDATGDCTLVRRSGGAVEYGSNRNTPWFVEYQKDNNGFYSLGDPVIMKTLGANSKENDVLYCRSGKDNTAFIREAWQIIRDRYDALYKENPHAKREVYPLTLPAMAQYRKIARIKGKATIRTGEYNCHREDSIGMTGDWRSAGKIWETPYGALLPETLDGVLAAGRCIASDGDSWEAYRVIPAAAMTGEVAAVAASLAVEKKISAAELDLEELRGELRKNAFRFHREEVL